jgi:hypothetical protein
MSVKDSIEVKFYVIKYIEKCNVMPPASMQMYVARSRLDSQCSRSSISLMFQSCFVNLHSFMSAKQ